MTKKLLCVYLFMTMLIIGCHESTLDKIDQTMDTEMNSTQNNEDWLLTEDEAKVALIKMQDNTEEEYRREKKMVEEAEEAERKWHRENEGTPPESLSVAVYEASHYGLWDRIREQREIYEKYGDVDFDEHFQEFIEIEYEYEYEIPQMNNKRMYVCKWECDLKEGLFRIPVPKNHRGIPSYGRFIKDDNGEWTAIIVLIGGLSQGDRSPLGDQP